MTVRLVSDTKPEQSWKIDVNCGSDWQRLTDHVAQCLRPLNYSEIYGITHDEHDTRDQMRMFISPDGHTSIHLKNNILSPTFMKAEFEMSLTITVDKSPLLNLINMTGSGDVQYFKERL